MERGQEGALPLGLDSFFFFDTVAIAVVFEAGKF